MYVAGQRKVWCAKRFAPLSPTPRSPEAPCTAAVYGLQQASTVLNSSDDIWTRPVCGVFCGVVPFLSCCMNLDGFVGRLGKREACV